MRRRLWNAVAEIELNESMKRGLPSLADRVDSDVDPPGHLENRYYSLSEVDDGKQTDNTPSKVPSFAMQAHILRKLRYKVSALMNSSRKRRAFTVERLNILHQDIFAVLTDLGCPKPQELNLHDMKATSLRCSITKIQLYELLTLVHFPFAFGQDHTASVRYHSRSVCSNAAIHTIESFQHLCDNGYSSLFLARDALLRATLVLCLLNTSLPRDGKQV